MLITRVQTSELSVNAVDEAAAVERVRSELERPFGSLRSWRDQDYQVTVAEVVRRIGDVELASDSSPLVYDIKGAAEQLGISRSTLHELLRNGEIEHVRVGRRVMISRRALEGFVEAHSRMGY
jgi:excisionase family DNA binding protein